MKKLFPVIKEAIKAGLRGIPLAGTIMGLFHKTDDKGNITAPAEKVDTGWILKLVVEGAAVYGIIYLMNKYGVTLQDIKDLFGLFNQK